MEDLDMFGQTRSALDTLAAQRPLTPIEAQLKFLESQNRQLIKMLVDSENLKRDKIIVCAACFEKILAVDKAGTK